ncbi:hypothetical protein O1W68_20210 [Rhodococcus sp. H36-A4]|uniref:hypothetical protein n=1 Tax=Rhodococcus sp. H36-A4 TaxID=3004353 RepID=UPI0022B0121C|nr:hypothetical protein [Rhodococcus sp. H36-A4]MCZ4080275.1 hypothetical protein [Rhodococcus sp. H36-A4]
MSGTMSTGTSGLSRGWNSRSAIVRVSKFVESRHLPTCANLSQFSFNGEVGKYVASDWGSADYRRFNILDALVHSGAIDINDVPDVYKSENGKSLLSYSDVARGFSKSAGTDGFLANQSAMRLIAGGGVSDLDEKTRNATDDGQQHSLELTIRPLGNNPGSAEILQWSAGDDSSSDPKSKWPWKVLG